MTNGAWYTFFKCKHSETDLCQYRMHEQQKNATILLSSRSMTVITIKAMTMSIKNNYGFMKFFAVLVCLLTFLFFVAPFKLNQRVGWLGLPTWSESTVLFAQSAPTP